MLYSCHQSVFDVSERWRALNVGLWRNQLECGRDLTCRCRIAQIETNTYSNLMSQSLFIPAFAQVLKDRFSTSVEHFCVAKNDLERNRLGICVQQSVD